MTLLTTQEERRPDAPLHKQILRGEVQPPEYCPDDLTDDEICPACGASPDLGGGVCLARKWWSPLRPLVELVLVNRKTGKII